MPTKVNVAGNQKTVSGFPFLHRQSNFFSYLGDNIRQQQALDMGHIVLELKLAFFQALQLNLVERRRFRDSRNHIVEVAVLALQPREFFLQGFLIHRHTLIRTPMLASADNCS